MTEFYFDTRDGALLVGASAAEPRLEEAGSDVLPFVDLLTAEVFPYKSGDFGSQSVTGWEKKDYESFGKWIFNAVLNSEKDAQKIPLTTEHLARLHILRLCPSRNVITKRYGDLRQLNAAIGSPNRQEKNVYDEWVREDFVKYASQISRSLGRKPMKKDYLRYYKKARGPSPYILETRIGSITRLNEYLGYVDVRDWDEEEYIEWGQGVLSANEGKSLSWALVDILSKRKRGPSMRAIRNHFDDMHKFTVRVNKLAEIKKQEEKRKVVAYDLLCQEKDMPNETLERADQDKLAFIAKYWLSQKCLPYHEHSTHMMHASAKSSDIVLFLKRYNPHLTAGQIELNAIALGVFDDIWSQKKRLRKLYVSEEELAKHRRNIYLKRSRKSL